jgi:hypothetical protein
VLPTVAIDALALSQVPPPTELLRVVVDPAHTVAVPVLAGTPAFTVKVLVAIAPQPVLYNISVVPAVSAEITPVVEFIVARAVVLLVQLP